MNSYLNNSFLMLSSVLALVECYSWKSVDNYIAVESNKWIKVC